MKIITLLLLGLLAVASPRSERPIAVWVTAADQSRLFQHEEVSSAEKTEVFIEIDTAKKFQEMDGFGAAMTGSSAYVLHRYLDEHKRHRLLTELFDPQEGIGLSYLRMSIGASDFSLSAGSYDDMPPGKTDFALDNFSIEQEKADLIPMLREVFRINPRISLMGSPWSAPGWMKDSGVMEGGKLKKEAYPAFARYFVKYIEAFAAEGIPVKAVTVQNEPQHQAKYPSMAMSAEEQSDFIKNHLGPLLRDKGLSTRIMLFDHNWNSPQYPISILNDRQTRKYVAGSAFHCYEGRVDAMSKVREAHPDKGLYFTECSNGVWRGSWSNSFRRVSHMIIDVTRNWGKNFLMWNLALDENHGPTTNPPPGPDRAGNFGCMHCLGVVTIESRTGKITREADYYAFAHFAKFVRPGAHRVFSSFSGDSTIKSVAFLNTDGTRVLIVFNDSAEEKRISFNEAARRAAYVLPARSLASFVWR